MSNFQTRTGCDSSELNSTMSTSVIMCPNCHNLDLRQDKETGEWYCDKCNTVCSGVR